MPPRGRPRKPGTDKERAQQRRDQVRQNVRAYRKRQAGQTRSRQNSEEESDTESTNIRSDLCSSIHATTSSKASRHKEFAGRSFVVTQEPQCLDQAENLSWSIKFPYQFNLGPAYMDVYVSASEELTSTQNLSPLPLSHRIPRAHSIRLQISCGVWSVWSEISSTFPGADSLSDILIASSLNNIGISTGDAKLIRKSLEIQDDGLRKLRRAVEHFLKLPSEGNGIALACLATITLATAMSELISNKSWEKFYLHLNGVGALLQYVGPQLRCPSLLSHFYGYRTIQLTFSLMYRQQSFLSQQQWIDIAKQKSHPAANLPIHHLINIAYAIPQIMEAFDKDNVRAETTMIKYISSLIRLRSELDIWQSDLEKTSSTTLKSQLDFLAQRQVDHTAEFYFDDDSIAYVLMYYMGVRLALAEITLQIARQLATIDIIHAGLVQKTSQNAVTYCVVASQCINYCLARHDIAGKFVCYFPFEMTWRVIESLVSEYGYSGMDSHLAWFREKSILIQESGLPVMAHRVPV